MKVFVGADHRGFALKEQLKEVLGSQYEVIDLGNEIYDEDDDYPDFAGKLPAYSRFDRDSAGEREIGILICETGEGMTMVANKIKGVRAALCWNEEIARLAREHEDANVLCLPADYINEKEAVLIVETFLKTEFSRGERHIRRIGKIGEIEWK